jgi:hypothetical protein
MRFTSPPSRRGHWLAGAVLALASTSCAAFLGDPSREARGRCDKKDGPSCFDAGNLVMEKSGPSADAVRLFIRGCAVRHSPSCDALGNMQPPLRAQALAGGCEAGDLVSCAKRADDLGSSENEQAESRGIRHAVCKKSAALSSGSPAREVEGVAEACASLAKMISAGQGGGRDDVAAAKLDVLAQTLRNEALYRHEREDDLKVLPAPAAPPPRPRRGSRRAPPVDPGLAEREKFHREYEARRAAREAWIASVQTTLTAASRQTKQGDPSLPQETALERAASMLPGPTKGASSCERCVDTCGSASRCAGDDFGGGRCGHLRCAGGGACAPFDACVAQCAAKAETCSKACGECNAAEAGKGAK